MEEPNWTKQITNEQLCTFFYAFAIVYAIIGCLGITFGMWGLFAKLPPSFIFPFLFQIILTCGLAFVTALFHYLICQRALLTK